MTNLQVYLQVYDKLVTITKQGAPLELIYKKRKKERKKEIANSNAGKTLER